jgi:hypothetical protein
MPSGAEAYELSIPGGIPGKFVVRDNVGADLSGLR